MKLPNLFSQNKSKPTAEDKVFLAVLLTDSMVHAALWRIVDDRIVISHRSQIHEYSDEKEDQLLKIDQSLQDLGPDSEKTDDVVFGFEPNWVKNDGIIEGKRKFLKALSEDLSLNPVGYVVTNEALYESLLKQKPMLSAVILYIGKSFVNLNLIRQGRLIYSQSVGRSQDLVADLKEAVARFFQNAPGSSQFPPNVILASAVIPSQELKDYQQKLIDQNWAEELNFIQDPVIKLYSQDKLIDVVVSEGGRAVAESKGLVSSQEEAQEMEEIKTEYSTQESKATSFGVPVKETDVEDYSPIDSQDKKPTQSGHAQARSKSSDKRQSKIRKVVIGGIIAGVLALVGLGYLFVKQTYSVLITIHPQTQTVAKETQVILDPSVEQSDAGELLLKGEEIFQEVEGNDKKVTTGVKLVGEKAEGSITIFNKTEEEKSFDQGTILKTDDLEFVLNEEITVPAAESKENEDGDGETKEYGQTEANITASEIGADSNIKAETELQISDFGIDTYNAKVKSDFSGGSSREIRVVAEQDQTALLNDLKRELTDQAEKKFEEESGNGKYITATDEIEIIEQEFSAEVGDEVEELELDLSLRLKGLSYTVEDLKPIAQELLSQQVPENYQLSQDNPEILSQPAQKDEDTSQYMIDLNLSSEAIAQIDRERWQQELVGKELGQAQAQLNEQTQIDQIKIIFKPSLAQTIINQLPPQAQRVQVEVKQN
jgi:hypothetical protein